MVVLSGVPETATPDLGSETYVFPASFAQQQLWVHHKLTSQGAAYNMPMATLIEGPLDVDALHASIAALVRRHDVLRTTFALHDEDPVQLVAPVDGDASPLSVRDISAQPDAAREDIARRIIAEEVRRPFDLERGPLFRTVLLRLQPDKHVLLVTLHHIVCDGWSLGILTRDLSALYAAAVTGGLEALAPLELQYADIAAWSHEWMNDALLEDDIAYWRGRLAGAAPLLDLPTDHPRPAVRSLEGSVQHAHLSPALRRALLTLSEGEGATLFMTLLAAFMAVLARWSGQDDIVIGSPLAGRSLAESENLIGYFVNMTALRGDLSDDPTFRELLRQLRSTALDAYAHQTLPFEKLIEVLQPERQPNYNPLFQTVFAYQEGARQGLLIDGAVTSVLSIDSGTAKFDLTLDVRSDDDGLHLTFEYDRALFDAATISRLAGHLQTLLESVVADSDRALSALPLATPQENAALLVMAQGTADAPAPPLEPGTLDALFLAQAARRPYAPALTFEGETLSYGALDDAADRLARRLRALGVRQGDRVGLRVERSLRTVVGVLGILKTGAAYVPFDPAYPRERAEFMLRDAAVSVLVTEAELHAAFALDPGRDPALSIVLLDAAADADTSSDTDGAHEGHPVEASDDDVAYVIYTSGSTGTPKGVAVTHHNVKRLFSSTQALFGFDERDVWTFFHSIAFDFSVWELWGALLHGGRLVVVPFDAGRSPDAFYALLEQERVTVLNQTPSAFSGLMRVATTGGRPRALALREVIFGGEALDLQALRPWFESFGDAVPRLVNMYGITETTVHVTYRPLSIRDLDGAPGSMIGSPLSDLQLHVLDAEGRPAPIGMPGEMYVGGAGVALGYLNRPELTAQRFTPDPFSAVPGARLYRSGDRARRRANGDLEYLGRIDGQVKVRGYRIEIGEIENVLRRQDGVATAAVVVREDRPGDKRIVGYIVPVEGRTLDIGALHHALQAVLPEYMVPSTLVTVPSIALTTNGKIDRRTLPAPDAGVSVASSTPSSAETLPHTPEERMLTRIWLDLLGPRAIGVDDDFFDLGGHSLLAVRLLDRVERVWGRKIPLSILFAGATVRRLGAYLAARAEGGLDDEGRQATVVEVQAGGQARPFFFLHGDMYGGYYCLKIAPLLGAERPFYALPPHGVDGWRSDRSIESIAALHIDTLRAVQPHGPYLLGGFCNGGLVAYEMARQLQEQGQESAVLIAAMAATPSRYPVVDRLMNRWGALREWDAARADEASLQLQYQVARWHDFVRANRRDQAMLVWDTLKRTARTRLARRAERSPAVGRDHAPTGAPHAFEARARTLLRDYWMARRRYTPGTFEGKVAVLWPIGHAAHRHHDDPTRGWSRVVADVEVKTIPGTHDTCTTRHIGAFAETLRTVLDEYDPPLGPSFIS